MVVRVTRGGAAARHGAHSTSTSRESRGERAGDAHGSARRQRRQRRARVPVHRRASGAPLSRSSICSSRLADRLQSAPRILLETAAEQAPQRPRACRRAAPASPAPSSAPTPARPRSSRPRTRAGRSASRRARTPNAQMSARLSTALPRACSGLMYAAVPRIIPTPVVIAGDRDRRRHRDHAAVEPDRRAPSPSRGRSRAPSPCRRRAP